MLSWIIDTFLNQLLFNFVYFEIILTFAHCLTVWCFSAVSSDGQTAPRTGFVHNFKPKEVLVKVYDKQTEDFTPGM